MDTTPRRHRFNWVWGPAFVAAIAYVDPGNVAANLSAGAEYGYLLVWVLVMANVMAMLVQYLSAKLGLVTQKSLPELLGERMRKAPRLLFWGQAELVAAATDLAEVIGGAIALKILFGLPLLLGGVIIGVVSMGLLAVQNRRGEKSFEFVVIGLLLIITIGFVAGLFVSHVDWLQAAEGVLPRFDGTESVLLAASMLGATVMPHAIYVHSALTTEQAGHEGRKALPRMLRVTRWDVFASMLVAGAVNIAMLLLAAATLRGQTGTDSIEGAWEAINNTLGPAVGVLFGIGLLASGLASTSVGTFAGATIMSGLLRAKVPLLVMRLITLVPALAILAIDISPTWALVISQVFLSFGIPFALIPLVVLTSQRKTMGRFANSIHLQVLAWIVVAAIVALNVLLIILSFT
ncbi:MAG: Nramp family divalent metal transporter [Propionibacteriaceae bacterium]|jgi:manganese transport protein|nr:Nramp family divalent metal transporter [Propionibacteriaceae bacterium]